MYGTGTRSYNRSTEARENKRLQHEATERYLQMPRREVALGGEWLVCRCDGLPDPHPAHAMREILNVLPWFRWAYLVKRAERSRINGER
jgi:hypothetical protein